VSNAKRGEKTLQKETILRGRKKKECIFSTKKGKKGGRSSGGGEKVSKENKKLSADKQERRKKTSLERGGEKRGEGTDAKKRKKIATFPKKKKYECATRSHPQLKRTGKKGIAPRRKKEAASTQRGESVNTTLLGGKGSKGPPSDAQKTTPRLPHEKGKKNREKMCHR